MLVRAPNSAKAAANVPKLLASAIKIKTSGNRGASTASSERRPNRLISGAANCIATNPPSEQQSRASPRAPGLNAKLSLSRGIVAANVPLPIPSMKYIVLAAIRPHNNSFVVCLFFTVVIISIIQHLARGAESETHQRFFIDDHKATALYSRYL
ncbi:hypothetical protein D3C72_1387130 [compost metagenome]